MTLLIKEKKYGYELRVYNCGFNVSIHNSSSKKYIRKLIKKYSEWVTHKKAACYGHKVLVDWT
jgi:hypothetical protein